MIIGIHIFIFILGAIVGSFLGVIVDRITGKEPIWKGRSHCDHCRHKLRWDDLIPLASFIMLNRQCRYCHTSLSWNYFAIELVTGSAFVIATYALFQGSLAPLFGLEYLFILLYYYSIISALIAIAFVDIKFGIIPFKIIGAASIITIAWYFLFSSLYITPNEALALGLKTDILNALLTAVSASLFFFILFVVTKGRGLGFGDVVFAFLMGLILGFPNIILAFYLAFVSGAIVALGLILTKKKKFKGGTIPFGPFLVLGTIVSLLWGDRLVSLAMRFLSLN